MIAPTETPIVNPNAERDARVLYLSHTEKLSEREIARRMDMSRSNVWRILQAAKAGTS